MRTIRAAERASLPPPSPGLPAAKPVRFWAAIGVAFVGLGVYVVARWVGSGSAGRLSPGPDKPPGWVLTVVHGIDVVAAVLCVVFAYWFLIKPWRERRELTGDGMLMIAMFGCALYDPCVNYVAPQYHYNAYHLQLGSWAKFVPGLITPRAELAPEPLILAVLGYVWAMFIPVLLGTWVMRKAHQRWPALGRVGLYGTAVLSMALFDVLELLLVRGQIGVWGATIKAVTLWPGSMYQFPLYEPLLVGIVYGAFAAMRYFRDDRGLMFPERGVDGLGASPRQRTLWRFFAVMGGSAVLYGGLYILPLNFAALHADSTSDLPSYLRNPEICGPGSPYPCPGPDTPIYRR